ncbi:hypothetical protein BGZ60DRAFT_480412 [Tricladium varicosporioides]|nr:hypothetical protein BGZ60DRAFT_480412 [Hymenoscyphus varicosporioides]
MVVFFEGPSSATGENVLELYIHGGTATVKAVLEAIPRCAGPGQIRYAEAGEFTKRAFENKKLEMGEVEALGDILSAETEQQRLAAIAATSKVLTARYDNWRTKLVEARGEMEALIDFSEDQHFDESPATFLSNIAILVKDMLHSIKNHESASYRGELLKRGIRISLLGPPNAGKSSLLNLLVGREASIVSQEAGTTRDVIEVSLDIKGYLCTFADTAGLRTSSSKSSIDLHSTIGAIEQEGIRRAKAKASESNIIIAMASIEPSPSNGGYKIVYDSETLELASKAEQAFVIINKCDRLPSETLDALISNFKINVLSKIPGKQLPIRTISCQVAPKEESSHYLGITDITDDLVTIFKSLTHLPLEMQDLLGVTERQRQLLVECSVHLRNFLGEAEEKRGDCDIVLAAEHLRSAASCLARITGRGLAGDIEEVLGVVFEKFCVGK